jgi:hypothetical protein
VPSGQSSGSAACRNRAWGARERARSSGDVGAEDVVGPVGQGGGQHTGRAADLERRPVPLTGQRRQGHGTLPTLVPGAVEVPPLGLPGVVGVEGLPGPGALPAEEPLGAAEVVGGVPVVDDRFVPGRGGERQHLRAVGRERGTLPVEDVVGERERVCGGPRRCGLGGVVPVPGPDRVGQQVDVGPVGADGLGHLAGDAVVTVSVPAPGRDEERAAGGGVEPGDQGVAQRVRLLAEADVGHAEGPGRDLGVEQFEGVAELDGADGSELVGGGRGGVGVRPLAERDEHDVHGDARVGRRGDEATGAECLVVRVRRDDDDGLVPVEVDRVGGEPVEERRPGLGVGPRLPVVEAHHATPPRSRTIRPMRARSRSPWSCST